MEPWQERVAKEKRDLDARIHRLRAVLTKSEYNLSILQRNHMEEQLGYMLAYSSKLQHRLDDYGDSNGTI